MNFELCGIVIKVQKRVEEINFSHISRFINISVNHMGRIR